jgi:hypothetical protein
MALIDSVAEVGELRAEIGGTPVAQPTSSSSSLGGPSLVAEPPARLWVDDPPVDGEIRLDVPERTWGVMWRGEIEEGLYRVSGAEWQLGTEDGDDISDEGSALGEDSSLVLITREAAFIQLAVTPVGLEVGDIAPWPVVDLLDPEFRSTVQSAGQAYSQVRLIPIGVAPAISPFREGVAGGRYLVGVDVAPGEYLLEDAGGPRHGLQRHSMPLMFRRLDRDLKEILADSWDTQAGESIEVMVGEADFAVEFRGKLKRNRQ